MSISWRLKSYLMSMQIYTVTAFQKKVLEKTNVVISKANLCKYVNQRPKMLPLETLELICTGLDCELKDFLSVGPKKKSSIKRKKLSYKNTPKSKIGTKSFPSPDDYEA